MSRIERALCGPCRDGNVPVYGPNGYLWHEYSGDEPEPCADPAPDPVYTLVVTRRCEGCEGEGFVDRCYCQTTTQHMDACEGRRCLVCRGSGQVTDRIPVADALADAETLRRIAATAPSRKVQWFFDCAWFGTLAGGWAQKGVRAQSAIEGRLAASAAFRAVPGLRGEQ